MTIPTIEQTHLDNLRLDPQNPRLGRVAVSEGWNQEQVLGEMQTWALEELAVSFIENGFWPQEAVLCVKEDLGDGIEFTIVEGNRRIAALISLRDALNGKPHKRSWANIVAGTGVEDSLNKIFNAVPFIIMADRKSVDTYLGFRHVTGIKEWAPAEKAQFIAHLIRDRKMTYTDVFRKIGSKTDPVRRNFVAYLILEQMDHYEEVDIEAVESKFSLLFMSLREQRIRDFLGVDLEGAPPSDHEPVSSGKIENLRDFTTWLFGNRETPPVVPESREMSRFATILASNDAVIFLRENAGRRISFEKVYQVAGGEQEDVLSSLKTASFSIESALSTVHLYQDDEEITRMAKRVINHSDQLRKVFPDDA